MNAHNLTPHICAWCRQVFETEVDLRQHQADTRHRDFVSGKRRQQQIADKKMREYDRDKRGGK